MIIFPLQSTVWSHEAIILQKHKVAKLVKIFSIFYGTIRLITLGFDNKRNTNTRKRIWVQNIVENRTWLPWRLKENMLRMQRIRSSLTRNRGRPRKPWEDQFFDESWWNRFCKPRSPTSSWRKILITAFIIPHHWILCRNKRLHSKSKQSII